MYPLFSKIIHLLPVDEIKGKALKIDSRNNKNYSWLCLVGRLSNSSILPKIALRGQFFLNGNSRLIIEIKKIQCWLLSHFLSFFRIKFRSLWRFLPLSFVPTMGTCRGLNSALALKKAILGSLVLILWLAASFSSPGCLAIFNLTPFYAISESLAKVGIKFPAAAFLNMFRPPIIFAKRSSGPDSLLPAQIFLLVRFAILNYYL